eukprot:6592466-Pyramimonas_sp.AAC.1
MYFPHVDTRSHVSHDLRTRSNLSRYLHADHNNTHVYVCTCTVIPLQRSRYTYTTIGITCYAKKKALHPNPPGSVKEQAPQSPSDIWIAWLPLWWPAVATQLTKLLAESTIGTACRRQPAAASAGPLLAGQPRSPEPAAPVERNLE